MRAEVNRFESGDFRFVVELDTGSETGADQLTVWYAESLAGASAPLASFSFQQLLDALQEPEKTQVVQQWKQAQIAITHQFDEARENLRRPFRNPKGRIQQLPGEVQQQLGNLRQQKQAAQQQLERQYRDQVLQLDRQRFDQGRLLRKKRFGEPRYLRAFYFDEANSRYIENFCRKFAGDARYRDEVLSGRAPWVERNALFVRNLLKHCPDTHNALSYSECARAFFTWLCAHAAAIIRLPEYQQLQAIDNQFIARWDQIDPEVREAIEILNWLPGVTTKFSCQGVSGTVSFLGHTLLVVSEHQEHGYVAFEFLAERAQETIKRFLPGFPAIELLGPPERPLWELRSLGNNLAFRTDLLALARQLQENTGAAAQEQI